MAKDDVEVPARVPTKRRQLEEALPQWLAVWASDPNQPPSARRRAQEERDRRKRLNPEPVELGVLAGQEGVTPAQLELLREVANATGVERVRAPHPVKLGVGPGVFERLPDLKEIVRRSTVCVAAPPAGSKQEVWDAVRYAKHRKVMVSVVLPDGTTQEA